MPGVGNLSTTVGICDALSFLGQSCTVKEGRGMFNVTQTIPALGEPVCVAACTACVYLIVTIFIL